MYFQLKIMMIARKYFKKRLRNTALMMNFVECDWMKVNENGIKNKKNENIY
jgi:hypothetical protein